MRGELTGGKTAYLVNETNEVKPNTRQRRKNNRQKKQDTSEREQKDKHWEKTQGTVRELSNPSSESKLGTTGTDNKKLTSTRNNNEVISKWIFVQTMHLCVISFIILNAGLLQQPLSNQPENNRRSSGSW